MATETQVAKQATENTVDAVLDKIQSFVSTGNIVLPENYSPENAVRSAWLMLQDQVDANKKPVLEVCTKQSIANAFLRMVVQGQNPVKGQCYFIPYGDKLTFQRSYAGSIALVKRVSDVVDVKANAIYEGDEFKYEHDLESGRKKLLKHDQEFENIDHEKVKGAYAIVKYKDGTSDLFPMTIKQIRSAWNQGQMKGNSGAHKNFTDEMACKTVINRACKLEINSSDDSDLMKDDEPQDSALANVKHQIEKSANTKAIDFDDADVLETKVNHAAEPEKKSVMDQQVPSAGIVTENNGQLPLGPSKAF